MAFAAAAAVFAVGTGVSLNEQHQATKAQKAGVDLQRQQADLQAARQRRDAVRQARISYANAQQAGENQGSASSSSSEGGLGSISSQLGSNISFLDDYNRLTDMAQVEMGKAITHSGNAQTADSIAGFAGSLISGGYVKKPK